MSVSKEKFKENYCPQAVYVCLSMRINGQLKQKTNISKVYIYYNTCKANLEILQENKWRAYAKVPQADNLNCA